MPKETLSDRGRTPLGALPAPDIVLPDQTGATVHLEALRGRPVVLTFLNVVGILTTSRMRAWRRGMIVGIAVFSAVITPSTDPYTFTFMAAPLYLLYEVCRGFVAGERPAALAHAAQVVTRHHTLEDVDLGHEDLRTVGRAPARGPRLGMGPEPFGTRLRLLQLRWRTRARHPSGRIDVAHQRRARDERLLADGGA